MPRARAAAALQTDVSFRAPPSYRWTKACIDRYLAAVALLFGWPVLAFLAWRIRRDSSGPALFVQERAGRCGQPFPCFKFRTMRIDADPFGDSPQTGEDPRITLLGRRLRESSLDELPQLLNVLRGEMSLVGPRPLYVQQIREWDARQRGRLLVQPGMTGLSQVNGRASITMEAKMEIDVRYVETASLRNDLGILWATVRSVWNKSGIYEVRYSEHRSRRSER
jgi:lipopolysaccharide/colanic/teichoic acid biosynthesis glycosyltransferase